MAVIKCFVSEDDRPEIEFEITKRGVLLDVTNTIVYFYCDDLNVSGTATAVPNTVGTALFLFPDGKLTPEAIGDLDMVEAHLVLDNGTNSWRRRAPCPDTLYIQIMR